MCWRYTLVDFVHGAFIRTESHFHDAMCFKGACRHSVDKWLGFAESGGLGGVAGKGMALDQVEVLQYLLADDDDLLGLRGGDSCQDFPCQELLNIYRPSASHISSHQLWSSR